MTSDFILEVEQNSSHSSCLHFCCLKQHYFSQIIYWWPILTPSKSIRWAILLTSTKCWNFVMVWLFPIDEKSYQRNYRDKQVAANLEALSEKIVSVRWWIVNDVPSLSLDDDLNIRIILSNASRFLHKWPFWTHGFNVRRYFSARIRLTCEIFEVIYI